MNLSLSALNGKALQREKDLDGMKRDGDEKTYRTYLHPLDTWKNMRSVKKVGKYLTSTLIAGPLYCASMIASLTIKIFGEICSLVLLDPLRACFSKQTAKPIYSHRFKQVGQDLESVVRHTLRAIPVAGPFLARGWTILIVSASDSRRT